MTKAQRWRLKALDLWEKYYATGDPAYANKAVKLERKWNRWCNECGSQMPRRIRRMRRLLRR